MKRYKNFDLTEYNSYKISAKCAEAFFPETEDEIVSLYSEFPSERKIVIGDGNNIILSQSYYDAIFVIFKDTFNKVTVEANQIESESGATMKYLSEVAESHSLSGLEIFYDIPSSVGGAVVMNAGTKDGEIKDVLIKVRYLDLMDLKIRDIEQDVIGFEYRNSFFQKHRDKIVTKAWFKLNYGDSVSIRKKMEEYKAIRWFKQPREFPNCGSVFKRPKGRYVGPMLDELGLKGFQIGGARISEKHSGFIVNCGDAIGRDILNLISEVQKRVKDKFGVDLEVEQRII